MLRVDLYKVNTCAADSEVTLIEPAEYLSGSTLSVCNNI